MGDKRLGRIAAHGTMVAVSYRFSRLDLWVFGYYLMLGWRSLRANVILTTLVVIAIGIGIGASMTMLTIFLNVSGDPIPDKSAQLFTPQIDNWGPANPVPKMRDDKLPLELSYIDAIGLMRAHAAKRQTAITSTRLAVTPPDPRQLPFTVSARATYTDFFSMFEVPFQFGAPWNASEDEGRVPLVVISRELNDRLFAGANSVGRSLRLGTDVYKVAGVMNHWAPVPRFYDLQGGISASEAQIYLPFTLAIAWRMPHGIQCPPGKELGSGPDALLSSECVWIQLWVELPTPDSVRAYRAFLQSYADSQRRDGRFDWPGRIALRDVRQWLSYNHVLTTEVRALTGASLAFLLVCLLNAMGLMLAKFMARSAMVSVRRALGADRGAIFGQCFVETIVIGMAGGTLGLGLMAFGVIGTESLMPQLPVRLGFGDVLICVGVAVGATVLAGLYPTWKACQLQPAWQLKAH